MGKIRYPIKQDENKGPEPVVWYDPDDTRNNEISWICFTLDRYHVHYEAAYYEEYVNSAHPELNIKRHVVVAVYGCSIDCVMEYDHQGCNRSQILYEDDHLCRTTIGSDVSCCV